MVTICASISNNNTWDWTHLPGAANDRDLSTTLTHEFGHAIGLGHTTAATSEYATMNSSGTPDHGTLRGRWLYPWDIRCHEEKQGRRAVDFVYRNHTHDSNSIGAAITSGSGIYSRGLGSVRKNGNNFYWSTVGYNSSLRNSDGDTMAGGTVSFNQQYVGVMYSNSWLRELPDQWRTYYSYDYDSANRYTNANSRSNVYQYAFDHAFSPSTVQQGRLTHCTNPPGNPCNSSGVYSSNPISSSFDFLANRTVYAWVHHDRSLNHQSNFQSTDPLIREQDREILVSVGHRGTNAFTLNVPIRTGLYSSTNVALACGGYETAGIYSCIIVYTPLANASNPLMMRRFHISNLPTDNHVIYWDPIIRSVGWLNASDITAWYNANKYWIAHKSGTVVQVRVSNSDATSWSHWGSLGESIVAPQVISANYTYDRRARVYMTRE